MAQIENCEVPNKKLFVPMVRHMSLSKTLCTVSKGNISGECISEQKNCVSKASN